MTAIHSVTPSLPMPASISSLASLGNDYAYNDLRNGRVRALLMASLRYERTDEQSLVQLMKQLFARLVNDAFFYRNTLIWLAPPTDGRSKPLFTRNLGVYLGLRLVHTYINSEAGIPYILDNICLAVELHEITSVSHRKRISKLLKEPAASLSTSDFYYLVDYYKTCQNPVVLEALVCLCFSSRLFCVDAIFQQLKVLLSEADPIALELVSSLRTAFVDRYPVPSFSIDLADDVVSALVRNRFKAICQFCGDAFVDTVLLTDPAKNKLKPTEWLSRLQDRYPDRNIVFRQLLRRERFLMEMPAYIFTNQTNTERFAYHLDFLTTCYQSDLAALCRYRFRLDTTKFIYRFDTFCIKLLLPQDFAELNHPMKLRYFRQYYRNVQFSLLLAKRHEKEIVWQGRSFTDNLEVDFLFFFMNDFRSINEYKTHFIANQLTDADILEIFFWALELGIVEPAPPPASHMPVLVI